MTQKRRRDEKRRKQEKEGTETSVNIEPCHILRAEVLSGDTLWWLKFSFLFNRMNNFCPLLFNISSFVFF